MSIEKEIKKAQSKYAKLAKQLRILEEHIQELFNRMFH